MKFYFLSFVLSVLSLLNIQAQEFDSWNPADFDLGRNEINSSFENFDFGFNKSNFDLPSGSFLNVEEKPNGVNIAAIIEERNNYRHRTVDLGSPLPRREKKDFEVSNRFGVNRQPEVENDALNSNPYYRNQKVYQNALHNAGRWNMYGRGIYSPYGRYY